MKRNCRNVPHEKLEQNFAEDDRAVIDNYQYATTILFISKKIFLIKKIPGVPIIASCAGELIHELANTSGFCINAFFNPCSVASRINRKIITEFKRLKFIL